MEHECICPLLDDAKRDLADIAFGRTYEAHTALAQLQLRRATTAKPTQAIDKTRG